MSTGTAPTNTDNNDSNGNENGEKQRRRKRRWGDATAAAAATVAPAASTSQTAPIIDSKAKALALQESVRARLAALKARTGAASSPALTKATTTTTTSMKAGTKRPAPATTATATPTKRAKNYELDLSVTGPTFQQEAAPAPAKPKVNPYLAHLQSSEAEGTTDDKGTTADFSVGDTSQQGSDPPNAEKKKETEEWLDEGVDDRIQTSKLRKRHKALKFVEPGTFVEIAERKRSKAANAEQSGFVSGRKAGNFVSQQTMMANIYGSTQVMEDDGILAVRPEANEKTVFPQIVEWWDMELLPSKLKKQVAAYEGKLLQEDTQSQLSHHHLLESKQAVRKLEVLENTQGQELQTQCLDQAALSYSKTAGLIQHIVPIKPPNAKEEAPAEPTLYLTKKELKRQRKLRRHEKQRELQDLQAAGLVAAPEPRLTLQNFIRVLGDQVYLDPSQMEQKVLAQMEARQRAHMERNEAAKLTKEQRAAKLARKLHEDTAKTGVHVALFYVKDLSHPYHRTKVDLNAQQNNITGGVIECEAPQLVCVICEGGPKAIKRYIRLMTVRMKWKGLDTADDEDEDGDDDQDADRPKFNPDNVCELVWTGMSTKRFFKGFVFQACESGMEAAKILRAKGVGHFWDQILMHASGKMDKFQLKLVDSDDEDDNDDGGEEVDNAGGIQAMDED